MRLKLTKEQYDVIKNILDMDVDNITKLINAGNTGGAINMFNDIKSGIHFIQSNNNIYIESDGNTLDNFREIISNYLMVTDAFDIDYNITRKGKIIESLIDLFSIRC